MKNQPYNQKTAGSTFKNPEGLRAWELIKKSGCAGLQVGGAKVSDIHCNFLINTGKATAADIETLGETIIKKSVKKPPSRWNGKLNVWESTSDNDRQRRKQL